MDAALSVKTAKMKSNEIQVLYGILYYSYDGLLCELEYRMLQAWVHGSPNPFTFVAAFYICSLLTRALLSSSADSMNSTTCNHGNICTKENSCPYHHVLCPFPRVIALYIYVGKILALAKFGSFMVGYYIVVYRIVL